MKLWIKWGQSFSNLKIKFDYIEIENNISKSLKKFKELNNAETLDEIVIHNKNLDNNNKSINNDFVYNKDNDLLKEIENQTNSEEINDIHFKNILFNIVEENIKELDTKTESSEKNSSDNESQEKKLEKKKKII